MQVGNVVYSCRSAHGMQCETHEYVLRTHVPGRFPCHQCLLDSADHLHPDHLQCNRHVSNASTRENILLQWRCFLNLHQARVQILTFPIVLLVNKFGEVIQVIRETSSSRCIHEGLSYSCSRYCVLDSRYAHWMCASVYWICIYIRMDSHDHVL